jgi:flagellar FliL protein
MAKDKDEAETAEGAKKGGLRGKLPLIAMILPTVLLIAGALYVFVLSPSGGSTAKPPAKASASSADGSGDSSADGSGDSSGDGSGDGASPDAGFVAGKIIPLDPVTINLASGHYLKVAVALQATADAGEEVSGSKAMDALIAEFSGKTIDEIATQAGRATAKKALVKMIRKAYEKKVYDLYWTTFVMN